MGIPACARWARTWCLRPVSGRASTRSARGRASRTRISGLGGLRPGAADAHAAGPPGRGAEGGKDAEPRRRRTLGPRGQGLVGLLHLTALEGPAQALVRLPVDREEDDPGGVPVEPLVHAHVPRAAAARRYASTCATRLGRPGSAVGCVGSPGGLSTARSAASRKRTARDVSRKGRSDASARERRSSDAGRLPPSGRVQRAPRRLHHLPVDSDPARRHEGAHARHGHRLSDRRRQPARQSVDEAHAAQGGAHPPASPPHAASPSAHGGEATTPPPGTGTPAGFAL